MNKAFLSHSSAQKDLVRKIARFLGSARCIVDEMFFDDDHLIMDEILRKMNDADMFVSFVSNESLNSDWV